MKIAVLVLLCNLMLFAQDTETIQVSYRDDLATLTLPSLDQVEGPVQKQISEFQDLLKQRAQVKSDASLKQAYFQLGELYHAYGLLLQAETCYRNVLVLDDKHLESHYLLARILHERGKLEEAEAQYLKTAEVKSDYAPIWFQLAEIKLTDHQLKDSRKYFLKTMEIVGEHASIYDGLGKIDMAEENYDQAIANMEKALSLFPKANRIHYSLGMAYRQKGDMTKAREHLKMSGKIGITIQDPIYKRLDNLTGSERIYIMRGKTAFGAGDYNGAINAFRSAIEANPESATAYVNLAAALGTNNQPEEAIQALEKSIQLDPENGNAHFNLGFLLVNQNKIDQGIASLRKAVELDRKDFFALTELAKILGNQKKHEEALTYANLALEASPGFQAALIQRIDALWAMKKFKELSAQFEVAYIQYPTMGQLVHMYARFLASCSDHQYRNGEKAVELAQKVLNASPTVEHALTLAAAFAEVGRCEDAIHIQKQAIQASANASEQYKTWLNANLEHYQTKVPCALP